MAHMVEHLPSKYKVLSLKAVLPKEVHIWIRFKNKKSGLTERQWNPQINNKYEHITYVKVDNRYGGCFLSFVLRVCREGPSLTQLQPYQVISAMTIPQ
jgi:hypothetical protein